VAGLVGCAFAGQNGANSRNGKRDSSDGESQWTAKELTIWACDGDISKVRGVYTSAPLADVAECAAFNLARENRMLFAASIPYVNDEKDRQQTINILKPSIGFLTEGKIAAEKERKTAEMFEREAERQAKQRERARQRGAK